MIKIFGPTSEYHSGFIIKSNIAGYEIRLRVKWLHRPFVIFSKRVAPSRQTETPLEVPTFDMWLKHQQLVANTKQKNLPPYWKR